jgi:biopolymer transport protein ExbB
MRASSAIVLAACVACLSDVGTASAQDTSIDLDRAYRREFAFLEAERKALAERVRQGEQQGTGKVEAARAELDALQGQTMAAALEADRLSELLLDSERKIEVLQEGDDVLENLLSQAASSLEKGGIKLPDATEATLEVRRKQLDFAFTEGLQLLQRFSSIRREPGSFFAANATKVSGEILRVGNVASYGLSEGRGGALAPAGGNALRVWPEASSEATARALLGGEDPGRLQIFLYDSLEKAVESKGKVSFLEHVATGGAIAWIILGGGCLVLLMIGIRAATLWRAAANSERLVGEISPLVSGGELARAIELCRSARNAPGRVLKATLEHLDRPREQLDDIISEAVLHEQPVLDRFGSTIMVLAAVAPLMGLLGTVTGMISTFDVITEFGTGNPKLLSGGISEALVTTELGLIVAIPALLCGNMLSGWADRIKDSMDKSALRITNLTTGVRVSTAPPEPGPVKPTPVPVPS